MAPPSYGQIPLDEEVCGPPGRVWASGEYLLWWTKSQPLPPLLTTSPPASAGILGAPGTTILFGNSGVDNEPRSGGRFNVGYWLNRGQTTGIEASYFFLDEIATQHAAASDGTLVLARPFFDPSIGANNSLLIASPGTVRGTFFASTSTNLWGADVNVRQNVLCGCNYRVDLLAGYRFLRLHEDLQINETEISDVAGTTFNLSDRFETTNEFHGGQLGLVGEYRFGRCFVQMRGKVALGNTQRQVDIAGATQTVGAATVPGGFLALPTNMGSYTDNRFTVIPEVNINLGCQITQRLRAFVGYNFLYWFDAARPSDQIDLVINPTQPPLGAGLVGPARPAFNFNNGDFWAQGINVGLEFRF